MKRSRGRFELHIIIGTSELSGTSRQPRCTNRIFPFFFCFLHLSTAAVCYLMWQTCWVWSNHLHFVIWCSFRACTAGQDRWSGDGVWAGGVKGGGAVKKYYGMHFDLHDNLTPPVTLLHHHRHPSAYLHGDQQHRSTIMVYSPPPRCPSTSSFFFLFASEMILLSLCDMQFCECGGGRGVESRARGFYDNCPQYPSDWWLWDVTPPPPSSPPPPQMHTWTLCPQSGKREVWGRGEKMQTKRERGRNGEKRKTEKLFF